MRRMSTVLLTFLVLLCGCMTASDLSSLEPQIQEVSQPPVQEKQATYEFSVAFTGNSYSKKIYQAAANIQKRTDGDMKLVIFSDGQMGTDAEIIRAVQNGTLSIAATNTSIFQPLVPEAAVINIPACYKQYVQPYISYDGEFYEQFNKCFNKAGFELMVQESSGYRLLTSASSITSLEQLKGLRIRTLDNRFHVRLWELLDAEPYQNIEWSELYYALQEGVVEAQDNPLEIIRMGRLQDIHPYALNGPFFVTYNSLAMNKKAYDSLPADYQKILKEELYTAMAENITRMRKNPIEVYGLTINSLSQDDQELLKTLLLPMLNEIEREVGTDLTQALIVENQLKR
ncbi:TRAP transporter substrate-binding protein [Oscillospiraceae bacterium LTW-04]|nr:TRAP transporter substrate-binding protein [Oscillospiraceae bacterium MB24-C1]